MRNDLFDQLIKSRAKEMKSEGKPNWQLMSAMIDQWEKEENYVSDSAFDTMVASKLKQQSVTFSETNWNKLEKEIDRRRSIRQRILLLQVSSAAVFVLLAMLTFQLYPYLTEKNISGEIVVKENPPGDEVVMNTFKAENDLVVRKHIPKNNQVELTEIRTQDTFQGSRSVLSVQPGNTLVNSGSGTKHFAGLTLSRMMEMGRPRIIDPEIFFSNLQQSTDKQTVSVVISFSGHIFETNTLDLNKLSDPNVFALSTNDNSDNITTGKTQNHENPIEIQELIDQKPAKPKILLAGYYCPAIQLIQSPFDRVFNEPGYSLKQFNDGVGVLAGVRYKKAGLNTGVEYCSLEYAPRKIEEDIVEGTSIYLKNIVLKTLKVPFQISLDLFQNKVWQIYCKAGLSVKTVLKAEYIMEEQSNGLAYLIKDLKTNPTYANSLYSKKTFESGLIDEGNVVKNVSSSADFGVGIKRHIAKDTYAFIEPMMQIDIARDGFGPNHDKIHNLHMKAGVFVDLN
jgi:hypothetical protein